MIKKLLLLFTLSMLIFATSNAGNDLEKCWKKQVKPLTNKYLNVEIEETEHNFSHSMNPWEQSLYEIEGSIWISSDGFNRADTLTTKSKKKYFSKSQFSNNKLLFMDYGDEELYKVTESMVKAQFLKSCRYTPVLILNYFYQNNIEESTQSNESTLVYKADIFEYKFSLYLDREKLDVTKITAIHDLEADDEYYGFGDVEEIFSYQNYVAIKKLHHPTQIGITKLNNKLNDEVKLSNLMIVKSPKPLLEKPQDYQVQKDKVVESDITIERYTENISFINLHHCGTRSLMVEFADFVLVAESPLNSKNGELLLKEVQKIAPDKPIKYFVFGHFHPHYTGGIRPFIHQEAKIICVEEDQDYIEFIANGTHSIKPDKLQLEPKKAEFDLIKKEKVISDGAFEMKIYHIGSQSNHTSDYLIYYFPEEKMVFQDDLIWLNKKTTKENISKTTKGFYKAVKALDIEVIEVVQNWHVFDKKNKNIFKFEDIENIMTQE